MSWSIGTRQNGESIAHGAGQTLGVHAWRGWVWVMGRKVLQLEYHARRGLEIGAGFTVDGSEDHDVTMHANLFGLSVWFGIGILPRRVRDYHTTSLRLTRRGVHWSLWSPWASSKRAGFFSPRDRIRRRLFGREHRIEDVVVERVRLTVPLPEGPYPGTVQTRRYVYRRKRWPARLGSRVIVARSFKPDTPIPTPGNMESDFYHGDDAIWEFGLPDGQPERWIAHVVEVTLRDRRRHGGRLDWQPRRPRCDR